MYKANSNFPQKRFKNRKNNKMNISENKFNFAISKVIESYKGGYNDALDGDEVDTLIKILKLKINLDEGNINEKEYNKKIIRYINI